MTPADREALFILFGVFLPIWAVVVACVAGWL